MTDPGTMMTHYGDQACRRDIPHAADVISHLDSKPATDEDRITLALALVTIGSPGQWREALHAAIRAAVSTTDAQSEDLFWPSIDITTTDPILVLEAYLSVSPRSDADRRAITPTLRQLEVDEHLRGQVREFLREFDERDRVDAERFAARRALIHDQGETE